jgi:hypothetical protein
VSDRANVVAARPERRQPALEPGELLTQDAGGVALELRRNVRRGFGRVGFDKQVNVIGLNLQRADCRPKLAGLLPEQFRETFLNLAAENRLPILRAPDEVILQVKNRSGVVSIPRVNHREDDTSPFDTLQPSNGNWERGGCCRTRRNSPVG